MSNDFNLFAELLGNLSSSISIPSDFHGQASVVKQMLKDDMSGLISSLLDFQTNAASVNFSIETDSPELTKILNNFLEQINASYLGKIPSGINAISKEYYNERWSGSSFPVLKIFDWQLQNKLWFPDKMAIIDGSSIYAKDKNESSERSLLQYDYYLGRETKNKLNKNVIFSRPYGRWFDKYPKNYLVKTGIFHNFSLIKLLKDRQGKILNTAIPLIFLIKRGSEILNRENFSEKNEDYKKIIDQYNKLMKDAKATGSVPTRVTSFDEDVSHLIPDLMNIFEPKLFECAEKSILAGLGFLDIAEGASSSRRESILNPKPFQTEILAGVEGFKEMLRGVINLIRLKNSRNVKYMNAEIRVINSPVMTFQTDEFKKMIRSIFKTGRISSQTAIEICGELDYNTEKARILKEKKENIDEKFYPPITENREQYPDDKGNSNPKEPKDKDNLPDDKTDPIEKKEYKNASITLAKKDSLLGAPYRQISELPSAIKKKPINIQRKFMAVWNKTYFWALGKGKSKKATEKLAFRAAYSSLRLNKKK